MNDFEIFDAYRKIYTESNTGHGAYCDIDYLLRFWRKNKSEYLTKMFGDKLILERPIEYIRADNEMRDEMLHTCEEYQTSNQQLEKSLRNAMNISSSRLWYTAQNINEGIYFYLTSFLHSVDMMLCNVIDLQQVRYGGFDNAHFYEKCSYTLTINNTKINLQNGQKFTRVWGHIAKALNMTDVWEKFRIAHSQALNQKRLKGTLCLSIHPMDYATASDNDNGWSSCMSWMDYGCYRMGTVEMMNSPMVICAYLKSDKQVFEFDSNKEHQWNSKKWRAWIIVTPEAIICNRHYPYHQATFAQEAIKWTAELANRAMGWAYEDIHEDFYQYMSSVEHEIEYCTTYMYNDLGGEDVIGCFGKDFINSKKSFCRINFSGEAECMICGSEIYDNEQEADRLECHDCYHERECSCCSAEIDEDTGYIGADGDWYCSECFHDKFYTCNVCEEPVYQDEAVFFTMPTSEKQAEKWIAKHPKQKKYIHTVFKNYWFNKFHLPGTSGGEFCTCPDCANRYNPIQVSVHDIEDYDDGDYIIPDLKVTSVNDACEVLEMPGYNSYWYEREHRQALQEFWRDQLQHFLKVTNNYIPEELES